MELPRDLGAIVVPYVGALQAAPDLRAAYRVVDVSGEPIPAISVYLHHIAIRDFSENSRRSYANALLRWFRFLNAIEVEWHLATPTDFADFIGWMQTATPKHGGGSGKPGSGYAARTINLACAVLDDFYEFHAWAGSGPILTPIVGPQHLPTPRRDSREPERRGRRSIGRQKLPKRAPKSIPDEVYDVLFVALGNHRNRALVSIFLSTGARANELLGIRGDDIEWGGNRIRVRRKGGDEQWLPVSGDAMVWLRLYIGDRRINPGEPVWLTLRKPYRELAYDACRAMFTRAQEALGSHYTLHQLRHTAAYRMVQDPDLLITDVQWVLGHAHLDTTQLYLDVRPEEVYKRMHEHHQRPRVEKNLDNLADGYDPDTMRGLFGDGA